MSVSEILPLVTSGYSGFEGLGEICGLDVQDAQVKIFNVDPLPWVAKKPDSELKDQIMQYIKGPRFFGGLFVSCGFNFYANPVGGQAYLVLAKVVFIRGSPL